MKLDKIIQKVQENDLVNPLRAGIEKQAVLNELKEMNDKEPQIEEVQKYLKERFNSRDAESLEKVYD